MGIETVRPYDKMRVTFECCSSKCIGRNWIKSLHPELKADLKRFRKYNPKSGRDCLRMIRNKCRHWGELSKELQKALGEVPSGCLNYFTSKYPRLLLFCWMLCGHFCHNTNAFRKYYQHLSDVTRLGCPGRSR